jgi:HK97 family phage major capsid protein
MSEPQAIKIDLTGLEKVMESWKNDFIKSFKEAKNEGKGVVAAGPDTSKLLESLHKVKDNEWKMTEQWTIVIPNYTTKETAAHLRDYVFVSNILTNEPGDVANIPYVKDFDFEILGSVGAAFAAETTGIISSFTTTLYEAGAWTDVPYYLIERIDQNLLDELNGKFSRAAVRAEDKEIMTLIEAGSNTNFAGNVTRLTGDEYFYASNITKAMGLLLNAGKEVNPGECVLYLTGPAYGALLSELVASQVIAYAVPSVVTKGKVEELLGVKLVVGGYRPSQQRTNAATGTVDLCYLMRGKRAVALAPKRELLMETDKQTSTRKLRVTGSHTFALKVLDFKEIVRIWTSHVD